MTRLPFLLIVMMLSVAYAVAQEPTPLPIIERCITTPTEPPDDWTFDGTIITFRQGDGVHGFRADTPSRYYIAFDNDSEYARFGSLSPDGKWFASFIGTMEYTWSNNFFNDYLISNIKVVSTEPSRETYLIPFETRDYDTSAYFEPFYWFDNLSFAAFSNYIFQDGVWYVVEPFKGNVYPAYDNQIDQLKDKPAYSMGIREESTLIFRLQDSSTNVITLHITDPITLQTYNTCIETNQPFAVSPSGEQVAVSIGDVDGFIYILDIADWKAYRLDLAANHVIAWVGDE